MRRMGSSYSRMRGSMTAYSRSAARLASTTTKQVNKVNPTALILSGVLMLQYLGEEEAARKLDQAVADIIRQGKDVTYDLKPAKTDPTAVGTREMGQAIIKRLKQL